MMDAADPGPDSGADSAVDPGAEPPQRSIQAVEVAFRLIRALEQAPAPLSLKALSTRAGFAANRAHPHLVSFKRVGLVAQDEATGLYKLGPYALQLGLSSLRKIDLAGLARPVMSALTQDVGEASHLSVWGNRGPCILQRTEGARAPPMSLQVGYVLPTLSTATGRIFMAYLPDERVRVVIEAERARPPETPEGGVASPLPDDAALARLCAETRAAGLASTDSQLFEGLVAVCAPVTGHDGAIAAALTLVGSRSRLDTALHGETADRLRQAAAELTAMLGGAP